MNKNIHIAVLGCGNLGLSIVQGLLRAETPPENITATRRDLSQLKELKEAGVQVTSDNQKAIESASLVLVAVKPYNVAKVLREIKPGLKAGQHSVVSLATGVSLEELSSHVDNGVQIYRAMPNIAAEVGESVTCIAMNGSPQEEDMNAIRSVFDSMGSSLIIDEELMEAATILGACGVAFALRFTRAMIQGGIEIGFDAHTAKQIVNQTVKGSVQLLIDKNEHPEAEIDKVTTPKGCTIVGLNEMEHQGFSSSLIKGIVASYDKLE